MPMTGEKVITKGKFTEHTGRRYLLSEDEKYSQEEVNRLMERKATPWVADRVENGRAAVGERAFSLGPDWIDRLSGTTGLVDSSVIAS
jgi:hypothetical protein